jgi:hypothetical protein
VCAQATPGLEIPAHRVESGFIQTENLRSKGGERCGYRPGSGKGQPRIESFPHVLPGNQASTQEPFDQAIARKPERSKRADGLQTEQATPVRKGMHALQGTEQQTTPQLGSAHLLRASPSTGSRLVLLDLAHLR